jgi:hypothetical protein
MHPRVLAHTGGGEPLGLFYAAALYLWLCTLTPAGRNYKTL